MKAAFFDVDGTLTKTRVWTGILAYFRANRIHLGRHYLFLFWHFILYRIQKIGLISQVRFRSIWAKNLSWHFQGFDTQQAQQMWDWVLDTQIQNEWRPEMIVKLEEHKSNGDTVFLVSGGPVGLLERIAQEIGADYAVGTRHEIIKGVYTGKPDGEACQGENKALFVQEKIQDLSLEIDLKSSFAYADSFADAALLSLVGNPVAVFPDAELRALAEERRWKIYEGN